MQEMCKKGILPSVIKYKERLLDLMIKMNKFSTDLDFSIESDIFKEVSLYFSKFYISLKKLNEICGKINSKEDIFCLNYCRENIIPVLNDLRSSVDDLEKIIPKELWPYPTYEDLLYNGN